ncbi:MAG: hypothetical protein UR32_C0001G0041 [candidate division WS6 bacterium GW2011_GWE2_33_157]|uniref:Uncharacterized protein n=1 Tax=candidate division WS6 bacterium GW2011_GWB1_33_6 TaxID=1619088 RepID=A0A0G0DIZ2_9BACT|nr:MAG: hypothetical protein UR32_C0001G0041 [candidate division WS6 bacterium GW2011_GWE2_33_157]KKP45886.1 MAG: hypothetical protein UR36_C0003G0041 [candidate division WS6 bacterium GW2011_GWF1_33_233]KKP55117.1 MAG: hypothetical protein UR45_C0004G0012 [candidate division WS6 bacterium GW2011_WS6_33_547]KKP55347.1 MAG: hypothetical protein UR47_C0002G0064 [candidate division WS6 bacterium GW2011_GWB1_33_6]KKP57174.1 MAG: hypothetical protein UR49_C0002G0042 [candidate division WS6 bacterium
MQRRKYEGFSLIEILVVVALIIILTTITIVAINPAKNFRDTRNAQRSADVLQILNAVTQYTSEEGHTISDLGAIADCATPTPVVTGTVFETTLVDEYIVEIPKDPSEASGTDTGYTICITGTSGRIEVSAPHAEDGKVISVKR